MMTPEQMEWCTTLDGNCVQCKFQDGCEMRKPPKAMHLKADKSCDCPEDCAECPEPEV